MNQDLYKEFIKVFAQYIINHEDDIADIVDYNYDSPLYQYYHSHFDCDTPAIEDSMWHNFWADFEEAFTTIFKDYI